jgi:hypothetical protein
MDADCFSFVILSEAAARRGGQQAESKDPYTVRGVEALLRRFPCVAAEPSPPLAGGI